MKYIVFITTNLKAKIEGKNRIYIGVHETENPNKFDGYLGDGVYANQINTFKYPKSAFQWAVKKYGSDSFIRTTLQEFDTHEDAYEYYNKIVDIYFLGQEHIYNLNVGKENLYNPIYQFDLKGNLIKKWDRAIDAYMFYSYPIEKWEFYKKNKCIFLNSYWSINPTIDIKEYNPKPVNIVYFYSKRGKLKYLTEYNKIYDNYIKNQTLYDNNWYVSNKLTDEFIPKPRRQYLHQTFYVYRNNSFVGKFVGKELMKVINLHSWAKISNIFSCNNNWYKDFYITLNEVDTIPERPTIGVHVDIYDKYGNFIEQVDSIRKVKDKYNVPSSKLKNIQLGDKYFGDYIFKYSK